jgi:UDPglucose 6-dehydrogenase
MITAAGDNPMNIVVVGTGYVGLVTGTCFASWGHHVTCVDHDAAKIAGLLEGRMPIYEPGLDTLVEAAMAAGTLAFTTRLASVAPDADVVFIAVGTPGQDDGEADLSFVYAAASDAARHLRPGASVVIKSTVPVGTGDAVERIIRSVRREADFAVVSNPEFLREGSAIVDFMSPDRVVIGTEDEHARATMRQLYAPIADTVPLVITTRRTSELIKYAANAFLATKIAFINEMADLCERIGAEVSDLAEGMGLDKRIGRAFLNPGPGYGGSCFPKDTQALLRSAQGAGVPLRIVEEAINTNIARKRSMALKVRQAAGGSVDGLTIAVLGLAFKANTDDMRESPALPLISALQRDGATVRAYDPVAMERAASMLLDVTLCPDPYACADGADVVLIATEWEEFAQLDLDRLRQRMAGRTLVDLRNLVSAKAAAASGLNLTSLGRPASRHSTRMLAEAIGERGGTTDHAAAASA